MEEVKKIISVFIKQPVEKISENTIIGKTAIQGSILLHRMYAELSKIGVRVDDYSDIQTFGKLMEKLDPNYKSKPSSFQDRLVDLQDLSNHIRIGIDIENISNFKEVTDYREDEFYKQHFSAGEIAYCLLQPNPLQSFAGKFAAKESLIKCNNSLNGMPFNKIEILNQPSGQPYFQNFAISISHTDDQAIAVAAIKIDSNDGKRQEPDNNRHKASFYFYFSIIALIISIAAIAICFINL